MMSNLTAGQRSATIKKEWMGGKDRFYNKYAGKIQAGEMTASEACKEHAHGSGRKRPFPWISMTLRNGREKCLENRR